jgi:hypothetical protein
MAKDAQSGESSGAKPRRDETQITAPSIGPGTVIIREAPEVRLARHEQSDVDAMGKDKRREVVGHSYGPSKTRQILLYGLFLVCVAALVIGGKLLVDAVDTPVGKDIPHSAPWAQPDAKQHPPKPLQ